MNKSIGGNFTKYLNLRLRIIKTFIKFIFINLTLLVGNLMLLKQFYFTFSKRAV
jgi:hypothetical protein